MKVVDEGADRSDLDSDDSKIHAIVSYWKIMDEDTKKDPKKYWSCQSEWHVLNPVFVDFDLDTSGADYLTLNRLQERL